MIKFIRKKLIKKRRDPRHHLDNMMTSLPLQNDQSSISNVLKVLLIGPLNVTPEENVCP